MRLRRRGAAAVAAAVVLLAGCTQSLVGRAVRASAPSGPPASLTHPVTPPFPLPTGHGGSTMHVLAPIVYGPLPAPLRSSVAGVLPRTGTVRFGDVTLTGTRERADSDDDGKRDGQVLFWATDDVLDDAGEVWRALVRRYPSTGLYPVVLQAADTDNDDGRPWLSGEFDPHDQTDPDRVGPIGRVLAQMYKDGQQGSDPAAVGIPYGKTFPGLAPVPSGDRGDVLDALAADLPGRIGLVAVHRPADVPYAIGWLGATNYFDGGDVTAVLRSWEDRFGAEVIRMGIDYIEVGVPRPARTLEQAKRIAAEHLAFCPDEIYQGDYDTFTEYARSLIGATSWYCDWY